MSRDIRCTAIVLLGGSGRRMGLSVPKQYIPLAGKPLFLHCVETFFKSGIITDILLAVPAGDEEKCREYLAAAGMPSAGAPADPCGGAAGAKREDDCIIRGFCAGGAQRYDSVYSALKAIDWLCDYVFIHDGARPLVSRDDIRLLYEAVRMDRAAVAGNPCRDTVKVVDDARFVTDNPDRSVLWNVQTPQVFDFGLARRSYEALMADLRETAADRVPVTDDAYVVQRYSGARVRLVETGSENIKVTTQPDLAVAAALLEARRGERPD